MRSFSRGNVLKCGSSLPLWQYFKAALLLLIIFFLFFSHANAEEAEEGPEAGRELARHLISMQPVETVKWRGTLK
ncbi:MAG TPA: hypothetical protein VFB72_16875, partial [Verrucomicrobiae bacterium]|nr:hypothetical protein [Verrucomicrobiae bacterium]